MKGGVAMPRGDGTGPLGFGPMTGRGAGYCAGFNAPGYMHPGWGWFRRGRWFGRGRGWGRGGGRGWRHMYYTTGLPGWARYPRPGYWAPAYSPGPGAYMGPGVSALHQWDVEDEIAFLREQAKFLREELAGIEERLKELSTEKQENKEDDK